MDFESASTSELDTFIRRRLHFTNWSNIDVRTRWRDSAERLNEIERACRAFKPPANGFVHEYDLLMRDFHRRQRDMALNATQTLYLIGAVTAPEFERHINIPRSATALALNSNAGARWLKSVAYEDAMATAPELWRWTHRCAWRNAMRHQGTDGEIGLLGETLITALREAARSLECPHPRR